MSKSQSVVFAAILAVAAASAMAADSMGMDMKAMDTNKDGMVSKDEYMKYHEAMWMKMKKGKDGMVDMKDVGMMHGDAMKGDAMMKGDGMMKGGAEDKMKKDSMGGK